MTETAIKADDGKTQYHCGPVEAETEIALAFTLGALKYGTYNYRNGFQLSRLYSAAQRHLHAFWGGEERADDTGVHHLAHAACNLMMMLGQELNKPKYDKFDDRYKGE